MWSFLLKGDMDGLASADTGFRIPVDLSSPVGGAEDPTRPLPVTNFHAFLVKVSHSSMHTTACLPLSVFTSISPRCIPPNV